MKLRTRSILPGIILGIIVGTMLIYLWIYLGIPVFSLRTYFVFFILCYVNIYIHELGHVLAAKSVHFKVNRVMIGNGRTIFQKHMFGILVVITRGIASGQTFLSTHDSTNIRTRMAIVSGGGLLLQTLAILAVIILGDFDINRFLGRHNFHLPTIFVMSNIFMAASAILPIKVASRGIRIPSDGLRLLKAPFMKEEEIAEFLAYSDVIEAQELFENQNYHAANEIYRRSLEKFPLSGVPVLSYSMSLIRLHQYDEAVATLESVLHRAHDHKYDIGLNNNIAWAYLLKNDPESLQKAGIYSERAYNENHSVPPIVGTRGCVLIELGQLDEGIRLLKQVSSLHSAIDEKTNNAAEFVYLAFAYFQKEKPNEAIRYLNHLDRYSSKIDADSRYLFDLMKNKTNNFGHYV